MPWANRVKSLAPAIFLLSLACPAKAQPPDRSTTISAQPSPDALQPGQREPLGLQPPSEADEPFLGYFEGMDTFAPRRRANRPADLPDITTISPFAREPEPGEFPEQVQIGDGEFVPREWQPRSFSWEASNLHHQPLYFEEVGVERYGHSFGLFQPIVSAVKFQGKVYTLPYRLLVQPPCRCEYALGYYRPGDCAPRLFYRLLPKRRKRHRRERHFHVVHPTSEKAIPADGVVPSEVLMIDPSAAPGADDSSQPNDVGAQDLGAEGTTDEPATDGIEPSY